MDSRIVEPADVPALLRAALAQDEEAAGVILRNLDLVALVLALCAFINTQGPALIGGSRAEWDAALAEIQRQMSAT